MKKLLSMLNECSHFVELYICLFVSEKLIITFQEV